MIKNYLCVLAILLLVSCEGIEMIDPESEAFVARACGVTDPLQDLPWLKAQIENTNESACTLWQVTQGQYQGETVYIVVVSGALCCTCGNVVYDCDGEAVLVCDYAQEATISQQKIIWQQK